jgi:hypothetical protein
MTVKAEYNPIFIAITLSLTLVVCLGLLFLFRSNGGLESALLAFFLVPCMAITFKNPRWGLLALLIYLPFSSTIAFSIVKVFKVIGNVIKYTNAYPLYKLAKDAFYWPALIGILVSDQSFTQLRSKIKPLLIAVGILLGSSLLTLLLVNLTSGEARSLLKGLVGLKLFLGYIPLILCGYYLVKTKKDVFFVSRLLVTLVIVSCSLCLLQYFLLTQGICADNTVLNEKPSLEALKQDVPVIAKYAPQIARQLKNITPDALEKLLPTLFPDISAKPTLKAVCLVGGSVLYNPDQGLIRLPGTFSDPWQWAWFLIASAFITFATSFSDPSRRWRVVSWVSIALVLIATLISGQRVALLVVPITFLILLIVTEKQKQLLAVKLGIIGVIALFGFTQIGLIKEQINSLIQRWQYSPPWEFMVTQFKWLLWVQGDNPNLFGLGGLGDATSGARRLTNADQLIETFSVKLLYEMGLLGFLAFMAVVTLVTILTFKAYRQLKNSSLGHWALCVWIFILFISYNPWYYPLTVDPVNVYYWLFAGILLKLPELEKESS